VLLSDRDLPSFPAFAQLVQERDEDVGQDRVERRGAEQLVEQGVCARVVEPL